MEVKDAIKYFGNAASMCRALNICVQNSTIWKQNNAIPILQQIKLQEITKGELKANMDLLNRKPVRKSIRQELEELRAFKKSHEKEFENNG